MGLDGAVGAAGAGAGAAAAGAVGIGTEAGWEEEVDIQDHGRVGGIGMKGDDEQLAAREMENGMGKRKRGRERESNSGERW